METWFTNWIMSTYKDRVGDEHQILEELCLISEKEWIDITQTGQTKNITISTATADYLSKISYLNSISEPEYNSKKQKIVHFQPSSSAVKALERLGKKYQSFDEVALRAVQFLGAGDSLKLSPTQVPDDRLAAV